MKRTLLGVAAAVLGTTVMGLAGWHTASAADPGTSTTTVTLPLFGAPLTLDITTGPGGNISDVTVNPADGTVATALRPHKVVFQSANPTDPTADPARVVIKSKHGGQSVSARAGSLADVSGPGSWSGDVFGTGSTTTVNFTVGMAAGGGPDITGVTSSDSSADIGDVQYFNSDGHDDHGEDHGTVAAARVAITFTSSGGDQSRTLSVSVKVRTGSEHDGAKLSISLGRIRGVALDASAVAGNHTWNGTLCDGTAVTVTYDVAADGSVSNVGAPAGAQVHSDGGRIWVAFSQHEFARISVREKDGMITINASPMMMCKTADPSTNVDVSLPPPDDHHDGDWRGGGGEGPGGFGFRDGSHHHGD